MRFPEFQGSIETKRLIDITTWSSGGTPSKANESFWNGSIPWISASSMKNIWLSTSEVTITEDGLKHGSKLAPKGAILVLVRGSMLFNKIPVGMATVDVSFNQDVKSIQVKQGLLEVFLLFWFLSREHRLLNMVTGTGIGAGKLDTSDLQNLWVHLPSLPEQQKIADFLSAVDKKIQLLTRKNELLEEYKKEVMQKIFSREIRFKDDIGREFPEWKEKRLGDVATNFSYGMNLPSKEYDSENKYIRITDIDDNSGRFLPKPLTSPNGELDKKYLVDDGDILLARTGASTGKSYLYDSIDGKMYFAGFLIRLRIMTAYPFFIYSQLQTSRYWKWVQVMSMRSGQPGINSEEYKTFMISLSCMEEQLKIAGILYSLDQKIRSIQSQIFLTQQFKKGLLQQMFV